MNELQLTGTLIKKCEIEKGTSKAGKEYQNRTFVIEITSGEYTKQIAFVLFGDKTSYVDNFSEGDELTVKFSVESREYNGRYFSNINAYSVQGTAKSGTNQTTGIQNSNQGSKLPPSEMATEGQVEDEDTGLPF